VKQEYHMTVAEYAAVIRDWAIFKPSYRKFDGNPPFDPAVVFDFSRVAATWQRLRWDIHTRGGTPGDRQRLGELTGALQRLASQLELGTVDPDKFLPGDPSRLLAGRSRDNMMDPWFQHCMYAVPKW
jgi:hypothetical protein